MDYYKPGDVLVVQVTGMDVDANFIANFMDVAIESYGAFVDVPSEDGLYHGVKGFIHKSELAWDFVTRPETIVQIGK